MSVLGWIIVGFIAGGLARIATGSEKAGCLGTIVVGILGGLIGGALFHAATGDDSSAFGDFDLGSVLVAFVGAAALLLIMQAVGLRSRRH
jgi:uncharacterized membrane protein YeaQ/YmgE (transglycosylase-associated protein family)